MHLSKVIKARQVTAAPNQNKYLQAVLQYLATKWKYSPHCAFLKLGLLCQFLYSEKIQLENEMYLTAGKFLGGQFFSSCWSDISGLSAHWESLSKCGKKAFSFGLLQLLNFGFLGLNVIWGRGHGLVTTIQRWSSLWKFIGCKQKRRLKVVLGETFQNTLPVFFGGTRGSRLPIGLGVGIIELRGLIGNSCWKNSKNRFSKLYFDR